jgi:hypothetical protein
VGGCRSDATEIVQAEPPPTDPGTGERAASHTCGQRHQLIQFLKEGLAHLTPKEIRQKIRVARLGIKGLLNTIDMLEEDMQQNKHKFPEADNGELREQCRDAVQEYEESVQVWKEMKDTGDLCTSDTDLEEEDELTGEDLLQTLDKILAAAGPATNPKAGASDTDLPKSVLGQTILVSSPLRRI